MVILPESPKFLLLRGRKTEAIAAFNQIAKINGSEHRFTEEDEFEDYKPVNEILGKIKRSKSDLALDS